ncbi:unnamed protein product, partial [Phaeothamnion confervicola]
MSKVTSTAQSYEQARASFEWSPPARFNFARDVIDQWAAQDSSKLALWWVDDDGNEQRRTFAEVRDRSCQLANGLAKAGVKRGDTIVLMLGRNLEWWEIVTAGIRMGVILSPGTTQLSPKDIAYRMNAAQASAFITDVANAAKLDEVAAQCPTLRVRILVDGERTGWTSYDSLIDGQSAQFDTADTAFEEDALCYFTSGTTGYP